VGEKVLFYAPMGFAFTETLLGATNGPLVGFVFIKMPLKVAKGL
jgi:hypothetical protein